ncbi:MAG: ABC transporter ATP-binding protein [Mycobacteriales bacterium]|jgi:putative ABC transport system ATP-binding protein
MTEATPAPVVRLAGATRRYDPSAPPALDQVDLEIAAGEAVAVMGPSGSGKSTLLNLIAGLDRADTGSVTVDGVTLDGLSEAAVARFRRARIGMIFQFFNLLDDLTAWDNVLLPAQLAGMSRAAAAERAADLFARLGISAHRDAYAARLSGGERQRIAIARALMNRPRVLLADEPTGALDTRTGAEVSDLLRELHRAGHTLVLATHDAGLAARCAGRTIHLVDGRLAEPVGARP